MVRTGRIAVPLFVLLLGGCDRVLPGDSLGTYRVEGALEDNSCGASAIDPKASFSFDVELRRENGVAYWRVPESPVVEGSIVGDGNFTFEQESVLPVFEAGPRAMVVPVYGAEGLALEQEVDVPGCAFRQVELIEFELVGLKAAEEAEARAEEDGEPVDRDPRTFTGTNEVHFFATQGSDCSPVIASNGGPFLEFPCGLQYTLTGTERMD